MKLSIKHILIIISVLLVVFMVLPMTLSIYFYNQTFGVRIDNEKDYFNHVAEIYPHFSRRAGSFLSDQQQVLRGNYYYYDDNTEPKGVILIAHGINVGHENYMGEIEYFARNGYIVFGYDNTGVNHSDGDSLVGLSQAPIDLKYAIDYLASVEELAQLPLMLFGHSWGGFAVSAVSNQELAKEITAIVSMAGFAEDRIVFEDLGQQVIGEWAYLFLPYITFYEKVLFSNLASARGVDGIRNTDAKVLLIHAKDDNIVGYKDNFGLYQSEFIEDERIEFLSFETGGHRPTMQQQSFEYLIEYKDEQAKYNGGTKEFEELDAIKRKLIMDLNFTVLDQILEFYDNASVNLKELPVA